MASGNPQPTLHGVIANFRSIQARLQTQPRPVRLVCVSKRHPAPLIEQFHKETLHPFYGENYVQELVAKAQALPRTIHWHFIGHLQSNKVKYLCEGCGESLRCVETVHSEKVARLLDQHTRFKPLSVFVQVNTSGSTAKSGVVGIEGCLSLARYIETKCGNLRLEGVMTIGDIGQAEEDFSRLVQVRDKLSNQLNRQDLELSMGMSADWEKAVEMGSANVRVGSSIFGQRPTK